MDKFLSGRKSQLNVGISSFTENNTVITTIGRVGIKTDNASSDLEVFGTAKVSGISTFGSGIAVTLDGDGGEIRIGSGVTITNSTFKSGDTYLDSSALAVNTVLTDLIETTSVQSTNIVATGVGTIGTLSVDTLTYGVGIANTLEGYQLNYSVGVVTSLSGSGLEYNVGIITNLTGVNLNYSGVSTIQDLRSAVGVVTNISGTFLSYSGVGTFGSINATSIGLSSDIYASIGNFGVGVVTTISGIGLSYSNGTVEKLNGQNLNYSGISTVTTLTGENLNYSGIGTVSSLYGTDLNYSGIGSISSIVGSNINYSGVGTISDLTGTNLNYSGVSTLSNLNGSNISYNGIGTISTLTGININYSGVGTFAAANIQTLEGNQLTYNSATFTSIASTDINISGISTILTLEGSTLNYSGLSTISTLMGSDIEYVGISSLTYLNGTNLNYSGVGTIATLVGSNINYSGISSFATINGTNLNYSGVGTITQIKSNNVEVVGLSTLDTIRGTNLNYSGIGTIDTLSGNNINYSGISTFQYLEGTNLNYSGIGTISTINGTTGNISDISGSTLNYSSGTVTTLDGDTSTFLEGSFDDVTTINLNSSGIGTIPEIKGSNLEYTGIGSITNIAGTNLNYTGIGTIPILSGTNINYSGVGTITTLNGTEINISGFGTIPYLNGTNINYSGIGTISNLNSSDSNITNIRGTNLNYSGVGTVITLYGTDINYSGVGTIGTLFGNNINYSGSGSISNLNGTNLNYSGITTVNELFATDFTLSGVASISSLRGNTLYYKNVFSNVGLVTEISGTNLDYIGVGTIATFNSNSSNIQTLSGNDINYSGIGSITNLNGSNINYSGIGSINNLSGTNLNYSGIATATTINSIIGIITTAQIQTISGTNLNYSGVSTIGNVKIGFGNTTLIVTGDARVIGILTVGSGSVTINGNNNVLTGVSTFNANSGIITTLSGTQATYDSAILNNDLKFIGINTQTSGINTYRFVGASSTDSQSYTLTLPPNLGIPGQVLTLNPGGKLSFENAGLYENRIYVSTANGNDANDGKAAPVATIKRAAQLASFESFVLPGGRYLDAANLLEANKEFIKSEVIGFTTTTYPALLTDPEYDETICKRDIGYIVDAIVYDLSYGGNSKSVAAGLAYWNAGTSYVAGETTETVSAYRYIIDLSKYIINNVGVPTTYQNTLFQSYDLSIAYDDSCNPSAYSENCCADVLSAIGSYVGIVTTIIGIGTAATPSVTLPTVKSNPVCIFVEAGEYVEDNPIILYEDVAIVGDNLRNTIIRPLNSGKDLFRVRNGCYVTGFAMKDYVDAAGVPQYTFDYAIAFDDPSDPNTPRTGYAVKTTKPIITRSPYIQNCSILSFLGGNGILVDGSKVLTPNTAIIPEEAENPVIGPQPEFGKSMVANAFTMVSFGGIGWRVINDGYSQVVSCFQIFCRYGSLAQSGGYLSITNSATNFGYYALKSTGFNQRSYVFDRGVASATGTSGGLQTLKVIGLGRTDQDLYVLRFIDGSGIDQTSSFKQSVVSKTVNIAVGVNTTTDTVGIASHGFTEGDKVVYLGHEGIIPAQVIGGLVNQNEYYVKFVDVDNFKLYEDESLTRLVDLTSVTTGINTFQKGNQEFFNFETVDTHNSYQKIGIASTSSTLNFVPGRQVTQSVNGGTAVGYAYTYNSSSRELIVSVEKIAGVRNNFGVTGIGTNSIILDHSGSPVSIAITSVTGITTLSTVEFKVDSTETGNQVLNIANLVENYKVHFHRPSIVNSSSHTWEFSGSGIDYNALPQNGGKTDVATEQVYSLGGRVYSSGTNELGDFKIGEFIIAYNRTGNIVFNNKVSIGQLDSLRLSLSGGVAIEEFSTDVGLGDNEIGGPLDSRVSTQKAVRSFLNNRLGDFIDKSVSTNAVPSSIVQLNSIGQINPDLIPPKVVNYYKTNVSGGRTTLVDQIPAINLGNGDTAIEPDSGYVLISDVYGQYLILNNNTRNYNFQNGDVVTSTTTAGGAIGIVTVPTSVGYGTTGLVKGVLLTTNNLVGGSGYTNPGIYTGVTLNSVTGIGTSARATIIVGGGGTVTSVDIDYGGRGYVQGNTLTVNNPTLIGGRSGGSDFTVSVNTVETRLYLKLTNNQKFPGSSLITDYIEDRDAVGIATTVAANYAVTFNPTDVSTGGNVDFSNDRIIVGTTSFADGDPVVYSTGGGNLLGDLINNTTYYVKKVGISSVELYTTYALSTKKDLATSGTGTHSLTRRGVNVDTDQIVFVNHGFSVGDAVRSSGSTPTGITTNSFYFVGSATTNSFTLHATQATSLVSINGLLYNPIDITAVPSSGFVTFTKQNVAYEATVNTSSADPNNWSILASGSIDAANITSGTISPTRLGTGSANSDTFLSGDSSYKKVVKSVGIGTTEPITIISSSFDSSSGVTTHYGSLNLKLNRVEQTLDSFSTLGVSKFKTSTFSIGDDGQVSVKNSATGDIDAATLGGQSGSYYLDTNNLVGNIPITKGGTGLSALPSNGAILVGDGSAYALTVNPSIGGTVTASFAVPANKDIIFTTGTWTGEKAAKIQYSSNNLYLQYTSSLIGRNSSGTNRFTLDSSGNVSIGGSISATTVHSTVSTGTAPLVVSSTTQVNNLNAQYLNGYSSSSSATSNTIALRNATGGLVGADITGTTGTFSGNVSINNPSSLSFGSAVRQMINLWSTAYGLGVQSSTLYYRSGSRFSWHRGGSHSDNENDAGSGGSVAMTLDNSSNLTVTGTVQGTILISNVSTGTAPLTVTSTTQVTNLNASYLEGYASATTNTANTIVRRDSNGDFAARTVTATISGNITGVGATFTNGNFTNTYTNNVYANVGIITAISGTNSNYSGISTASRFVSIVSTGTAPLVVNSTTQVTNLNASQLEGYTTDTANTANRIVRRDGSGNFSAGSVTATGLTLNGGGSTTSAQLTFSGTTNNWITFGTTGVAAPAFTTRSVGTKVVWYANIGGSNVDYATGIDNDTLWHSVPTTSQQFRWYGGTTLAATLTGAGAFSVSSSITVPGTDRAFEVNSSGGVSLYSNEINAGALGGTGSLYFGYRRTNNLYFGASGNWGTWQSSGLTITGALNATTKSFVIPHPTKEGMTLRYGSLEGPENGIYVRGKSNNLIIELPDYWTELVHEDSITATLTPIGNSPVPRVLKIENNKVHVFSKENGPIEYFFVVYGERKDVEKLIVEY